TTPKINDTTTPKINDSTTTPRTNNSNTSKTVYLATSMLPNPRPRQRTFNSNHQCRNRRNRYDDPNYDPNKEHNLDNYIWLGAGDAN
ncbi:30115_t:CDS:2, partial [Gigaspora margarita]